MMDMLRRVLSSLNDLTVGEEVEVNIAPAMGGMMDFLYAAHMDETFADFAIHLKDGGVLKTNRMFACMFFGAIEANVSQTALQDPQRASYPMLDTRSCDLEALIKLMCGQTKQVKQSSILPLLPIAQKYGVPKLLFNSLVSESLLPVLDELALLKKEEEALQCEIEKEQLAHFLSFQPETPEPIWFGYAKTKLSKEEEAGVKIGQYYCIIKEPPEVAIKCFILVLVVSDVNNNGKVFVRYDDGPIQKVEEVDIGTFYPLVDFTDVTPKTVYPAGRNCVGTHWIHMRDVIEKTTELKGPDMRAYEDKIGHFCIRSGLKENERLVVLLLGVFDESSIWAWSRGTFGILPVFEPDMRWYVVDSIKSHFASDLPVDYTSLILNAPKAPSAYDAFPGDLPVLEPGDYVGCLRNFWGDVRRDQLTVALFLGDVGRDDHVYLFVGGSHPGIYTAPLNDLVYIEYD
jgi:hypothetical protein